MEGWEGQNGIHRGIGGELRGAGVRVRILQCSGAGVTEDGCVGLRLMELSRDM